VLKPGYLADVAILDTDVLSADPEAIMRAKARSAAPEHRPCRLRLLGVHAVHQHNRRQCRAVSSLRAAKDLNVPGLGRTRSSALGQE
jgi:hypothetical protein